MTIFELSPERRKKALALSFEKNDLVTRGHNSPDIWFVSSSTTEGHWYTVDARNASCECKAFTHYGYCRHLLRVDWEIQQARRKQKKDAYSVAA